MSDLVVELKGVSRDFPYGKNETFRALNNIDLKIEAKKIYCLVGPSGSGKTTLLHILGLLDAPTEGKYYFKKDDVSTFTSGKLTELRASQIGFMFQENYLIPYFTALENVLFPLLQIKKITKDDKAKAMELLVELGLERFTHYRIANLSGGQRQRVCIARALAKSPLIVIADEPSAALDSKTTEGILHTFFRIIEKENASVIVSTHDKTVMEMLEGNIIEIRDGEIKS